jgi:hypothetical protein
MELEDEWATFQPDVLKRSLQHPDRTPLIRPVRYDVARPYDPPGLHMGFQTALSVNISPGGLCILTDATLLLAPQTILQLSRAGSGPASPVFGEVRWVRSLPPRWEDPCLIGVKVITHPPAASSNPEADL